MKSLSFSYYKPDAAPTPVINTKNSKINFMVEYYLPLYTNPEDRVFHLRNQRDRSLKRWRAGYGPEKNK